MPSKKTNGGGKGSRHHSRHKSVMKRRLTSYGTGLHPGRPHIANERSIPGSIGQGVRNTAGRVGSIFSRVRNATGRLTGRVRNFASGVRNVTGRVRNVTSRVGRSALNQIRSRLSRRST
jgi:hypothetical protein